MLVKTSVEIELIFILYISAKKKPLFNLVWDIIRACLVEMILEMLEKKNRGKQEKKMLERCIWLGGEK